MRKKSLIVVIVAILLLTFSIGVVLHATNADIDTESGFTPVEWGPGCNDCFTNISRLFRTTDFFEDYTPVELHYNPEETFEERFEELSRVTPWMCESCMHYFASTPAWRLE